MIQVKMFICNIENCGRQFKRKYDLNKHRKDRHANFGQTMERCFLCGQLFNNTDELENHYAVAHPPSRRFVVKESAFQRKFITFRYNYTSNEREFIGSQRSIKKLLIRQIMSEAAQRIIARVSLIFIAEMVMNDHSGETVTRASIPFRSPAFHANAKDPMSIDKMVRASFDHQSRSMDEFIRSGSNWRFSRALAFDIEISGVRPVRGGCGSIPLAKMRNNKHLFSPSNNDNKCFLYCIAYFLLFGSIVNKSIPDFSIQMYKKVKTFNIKGISFPMGVREIKKFLNQNKKLDLSVNMLYRTTRDEIYPLEYGLGKGKNIVNILLVETNQGGHYLLIKNADRYLKKVYNTDNGKKLSYQTAYFCLNCLNSFFNPNVRDEHVKICSLNAPRIERTPDEEHNKIKFKNYERKHWLDYIAYLDFECVLPESKNKCQICNTLKCKCDGSHTDVIHDQIPICYSFIVLKGENEIIHEHTFVGHNAHLNFLEHLLEQEKIWLKGLLETKMFIHMDFNDTVNFNNAKNCYICNKEFDSNTVKCKDHCHFSGLYMGAACNECNLRRRKINRLKIFVHNASKYDMHFIIKGLSEFGERIREIGVLPYNGENFRTLRFNCFEFLDSLAFLQASLAQLSKDLRDSNHAYKILQQTYLVKTDKRIDPKKLNAVLEKSFFPYEYCTSLTKMNQTKKIPKKSDFYSSLSEKSITTENHIFAKNVWKMFDCKNLTDYTKLYCKIDTVLLAEIFQAFRKKMMAFSGLDPAHYISLPAYGYDSMLLVTNTQIELPTDINMVHFMEMCKRGGVSFINTRYLNANHFEKGEIIYQDRNNLYGEAQMQKLPKEKFRWLSATELINFDVHQDLNGEKGYFIECDLHYPSRLHDEHSNFPLAPEILEVRYENLSPYVKMAIEKTEGWKQYKDVKLMSTFHDKLNYVTHARNLQLYLSLGLKLLKIHRILEFSQDHILKPYIEMTTAARKKSSSKFEMDLFKKLVKTCFTTFHLCRSCKLLGRETVKAYRFSTVDCPARLVVHLYNFLSQEATEHTCRSRITSIFLMFYL